MAQQPVIDARTQWVVAAGARYWPGDTGAHVAALELPSVPWQASGRCTLVTLPAFAADIGVGNPSALLVDDSAIAGGEGSAFDRCNWLAAIFLFLSGAQERGTTTSSYAALLTGTDARLYERAWVNRIMLLLRRLAARARGTAEPELFGPLPATEIELTHDVDAISKTPEIRFKQSAFHLFNAGRALVRGDWRRARAKLAAAGRFALTTPSYWSLPRMRELESARGVRSTFYVYGGPPGAARGSLRRMLLDPGYDVQAADVRAELDALRDGGWSIGVHPSFDSWSDAGALRRERENVERACGAPVTRCRQHWLRFSWDKTWKAQMEAGFTHDATLGFNDRPGFRNGAALRFRPWDRVESRPLALEATPMAFMDSHFHDYAVFDADGRRAAMKYWLDEIRTVRGQASVNWHPHTLADDYGWNEGYLTLLELMG